MSVRFFDTVQQYFKVDKRDIAFLKFILEAYDGMAIVRTLDAREGLIELMIAPDFVEDVAQVLDHLKDEVEMQPIEPPADGLEW